MEKISRKDAAAIGANKYFTGEPCKRGHIAQRYTQTCVCVACQRENNDRQMPRSTLSMQGVVPLTFPVHRDDLVAAKGYLELLLLARGIKIHPDSPTAPPTREQRLVMWTQIHGERIARQMIEMHYPGQAAPTGSAVPDHDDAQFTLDQLMDREINKTT